MDALFELLKELIQDSERVPSLDGSKHYIQSIPTHVHTCMGFPACLETRFVASCSQLPGGRIMI